MKKGAILSFLLLVLCISSMAFAGDDNRDVQVFMVTSDSDFDERIEAGMSHFSYICEITDYVNYPFGTRDKLISTLKDGVRKKGGDILVLYKTVERRETNTELGGFIKNTGTVIRGWAYVLKSREATIDNLLADINAKKIHPFSKFFNRNIIPQKY